MSYSGARLPSKRALSHFSRFRLSKLCLKRLTYEEQRIVNDHDAEANNKLIYDVRSTDILDGKGGDKTYGSNKFFLDVKDKYHHDYVMTNLRETKQAYRDEVITEVKNAGYRFLISLVNRKGVYRERTKEEIEKKVSQALRERRKAITTEPSNAKQTKRQCISTKELCNAKQAKRQCISTREPFNAKQTKRQCIYDQPGVAHALDDAERGRNNNQGCDSMTYIERGGIHNPRATQVEEDDGLYDLSLLEPPSSEECDMNEPNNGDGDVLSEKGDEDCRIDWDEFKDAANQESKYQDSDGKTDIYIHYPIETQFEVDDGLVVAGESKTNTITYSSFSGDVNSNQTSYHSLPKLEFPNYQYDAEDKDVMNEKYDADSTEILAGLDDFMAGSVGNFTYRPPLPNYKDDISGGKLLAFDSQFSYEPISLNTGHMYEDSPVNSENWDMDFLTLWNSTNDMDFLVGIL